MNLKNLETRLDDALNNETKESLTRWLGAKRDNELEQLAKKHIAIFSDWQGSESHVRKLAFKIGYQIAKENITKEIIPQQNSIQWLVENAEDFFGHLLSPSIIKEAEEIHQKEIQNFGEWLLSHEIVFLHNTEEGKIYDYYCTPLTMVELHKIYIKNK